LGLHLLHAGFYLLELFRYRRRHIGRLGVRRRLRGIGAGRLGLRLGVSARPQCDTYTEDQKQKPNLRLTPQGFHFVR
jgi:hypothetical protein